jgi:hypothetical protein
VVLVASHEAKSFGGALRHIFSPSFKVVREHEFPASMPTRSIASAERKADWQKRKEAYLTHLDTADDDVLRVSLADKVHNARAILRDLRKPDVGESIWSRFSQPREKTVWYSLTLTPQEIQTLDAAHPFRGQ